MEIKIARALTEELVKVGLENLRDDVFEGAIEVIWNDYDNNKDIGREVSLNEVAKDWIEDTKDNCPAILTQKIKTLEEVEEYYKKQSCIIDCKKLWQIDDGLKIAVRETSPADGTQEVFIVTLKNGTIYNEKGEDIVQIDIDNQL